MKRLTTRAYIVATYRPAYPDRGVKVGVYRPAEWPDCAPPTVTAAWHVDNVRTKAEAVAVALESGVGLPVTARRILGGAR